VLRYLALGDSYTIGEGVKDQERWPTLLVGLLAARGIAVGPPHYVAQTAWTTDELSDAIDAAKPAGPFDLVTLLIGVNDQYRSRPVSAFEGEFTTLVKRSVVFAGKRPARTIVVSIPDWGATPFAEGRDRTLIGREIGAYNEKAESIARKLGAHWVDVTESSRAMLQEPELAVADKLHPSGEMYRRWAEIILPVAEHALRNQ
jgi:lysophospholipase L1-like esterase